MSLNEETTSPVFSTTLSTTELYEWATTFTTSGNRVPYTGDRAIVPTGASPLPPITVPLLPDVLGWD